LNYDTNLVTLKKINWWKIILSDAVGVVTGAAAASGGFALVPNPLLVDYRLQVLLGLSRV
jgi:hypothetical protein